MRGRTTFRMVSVLLLVVLEAHRHPYESPRHFGGEIKSISLFKLITCINRTISGKLWHVSWSQMSYNQQWINEGKKMLKWDGRLISRKKSSTKIVKKKDFHWDQIYHFEDESYPISRKFFLFHLCLMNMSKLITTVDLWSSALVQIVGEGLSSPRGPIWGFSFLPFLTTYWYPFVVVYTALETLLIV